MMICADPKYCFPIIFRLFRTGIGLSFLPHRLHDLAHEQQRPRGALPDDEDEGAVDASLSGSGVYGVFEDQDSSLGERPGEGSPHPPDKHPPWFLRPWWVDRLVDHPVGIGVPDEPR